MTIATLLPLVAGGLVFAADSQSPIGPILGPVAAVAATAFMLRAGRFKRLFGGARAAPRDLTDRALQDANAKLGLLTDNLPATVAYIDADETFQFVNRQYAQWYAAPKETFVGMDFRTFAARYLTAIKTDMSVEECVDKIRLAFAGQTVVFEGPRNYPDGKTRYVEGYYLPYRAEDDSILGVLYMVNDITRRHESEVAKRESEARYKRIFELAPDPIYVVLDDAFVFCNSAAALYYGADSAEQLLGRDPVEFYTPEVQQLIRSKRRITLQTGVQTPPAEVAVVGRDGEIIETEVIGTPISWNGKPAVMVLARDISERKRALEAVRDARDAAEAANRAKSEFLATMSHEIRTPMNGVMGAAELLRQADLSGEQKELAEIIHHSGETLLTIINDILDISKLEAGMMELDAAPLCPRSLAESVLELLTPAAADKNVELRLSVAKVVPRRLMGDPARLRQILYNLVGNAIKFTQGGRVTIEITLVPDAQAGTVGLRFDVVDNGIGIPAELQGALFERFTQVDNSMTRRVGGTGLGLAVCRELVHRMGGQLGVDSKPGEGSRFWFAVGLAVISEEHPDDDAEGRRIDPIVAAPADDAAALPLRVLAVDDNELNRRLIAAMALADRVGLCR